MIFWNTENVLCNLLFIIFKIDLSFYFLLFGKEEAGEKEGDNCFLSIYLDSSNCVEKFCDSWV